MKKASPLLSLFGMFHLAFAEEPNGGGGAEAATSFKKDKKEAEKADEPIIEMGIIYVGMTKETLLEKTGFNASLLMDYCKEGDEETMVFHDVITEEEGETITFYLKNGKIRGWKKLD
jgi:hypothetical protein